MCGIVGIAAAVPASNRINLEMMRDTMRHRGPDDCGLWESADGRVAFGHRRLAIIDLSPGGHQPMSDTTGGICIVFNGELYNYRDLRSELEGSGHSFKTASDTEVILAAYRAWGIDCLDRFNGMFAFGLYDTAQRRVFLARDRAGEKPLFYAHLPDRLLFASELKALMTDPTFPRVLDPESLNFYLTYGYVPGERCILKQVRKLAPGHALTYGVDTGVLRSWSYWKLPPPAPSIQASTPALVDELDSLLADSVRLRLVADVPVGVLLSGGIDSSLVTALAARVSSQPVKTFTIAFPGHGTYDESSYARLVARHFGTEHVELAAEPATVKLLPELAKQFDEPMADSSMVPTFLVSRVIRDHAKVALGGDGGDELFGGYAHYSWMQRQERFRRYVPSVLRGLVGTVAARVMPVGLKGRNHLIGSTADLPYSIAHVNVYFDRWTRAKLFKPLQSGTSMGNGRPEAYRAGLCDHRHSVLRQATEADFKSTMVDAYLVKVDRASMLASLEVRAPWLDHRIVEFAFGRVPDALRATETERKILPRLLAQRLLPSTLDLTRKQGFSMPLATWFQGEWGSYIEDVLSQADSHLFDPTVIQSLIVGQRRGLANTARLFALTMFELWRREYRVRLDG